MKMSKAQRLVALIIAVNIRRHFTIGELASEFGVSYRTIWRDLRELEDLGMPLYADVGAGGGYRVAHERLLPPMSWTEQEALAMYFAAASLRYLGALPFATEIQSVLHKILRVVPPDVRESIAALKDRVAIWHPPRAGSSHDLTALIAASVQREPVQIVYDGLPAPTTRDILPVGVYVYQGFWYCPAYCYHSEDFRLFRLDRIQSAQPITRETPAGVQQAMEGMRLETWWTEDADEMPDPTVECLRVDLTPRGVRRAQDDLWLSRYLTVHADGSGTIEAPLPRRKMEWCATVLWGWGTEATVRSPDSVIDTIRERLAQLTERYATS